MAQDERREWTHCSEREHQWEAREHARSCARARARPLLADGADAQQRKHQEHREQHHEQHE